MNGQKYISRERCLSAYLDGIDMKSHLPARVSCAGLQSFESLQHASGGFDGQCFFSLRENVAFKQTHEIGNGATPFCLFRRYFVYGDHKHESMEGAHIVNIYSFSKAYGMMGWRIGYVSLS
jgi:hypothetical protein